MKVLVLVIMFISMNAFSDDIRVIEADEITSSHKTKTFTMPPVSSKLMGVIHLTSDPCIDSAGYPEGIIFYNISASYQCFCNSLGIAVQVHAPTAACF